MACFFKNPAAYLRSTGSININLIKCQKYEKIFIFTKTTDYLYTKAILLSFLKKSSITPLYKLSVGFSFNNKSFLKKKKIYWTGTMHIINMSVSTSM